MNMKSQAIAETIACTHSRFKDEIAGFEVGMTPKSKIFMCNWRMMLKSLSVGFPLIFRTL